MNLFGRIYTAAAHRIGIYPHEGKKVIYIRNGEFHEGEVVGPAAFTGHEKLSNIDGATRIRIRNEAADALGVSHANIQRRLANGEMVMYRPSKESK
jgi:hypothetical protein